MAKSGDRKYGELKRWWGLLAGALLIAVWVNSVAGPAVVITLSLAVVLWSLFQAPVTCKAPVRGRPDGCRNNAYGLLLGCWIRQHRWRKLTTLFVHRQIREFCSGLFSGGKATVATLAGVGSLLSGLAAFIPGVIIR